MVISMSQKYSCPDCHSGNYSSSYNKNVSSALKNIKRYISKESGKKK